jgi:hypothetical protein
VSNTTQTADLEGVMRLDSSQVLGSLQLAGAVVTARGSGLRHAARVPATGLVGAVALGYAASRYTARRPSQTPAFGHTAFLAINEREVALIKTGGGGLKNGTAEVLARMPRSEVTMAAVSRGFLRSNLTISFADGGTWEFEVSPFIRSMIVRIVRALGY